MIQHFKRYRNFLIGIILSVATCLIAISLANPSQAMHDPSMVNQINAINYQKQAETELIAQGEATTSSQLKRFAAILQGDNIFPTPVSSNALGVVGAALNGNRLIVRGGFSRLSSPLRDYATDPLVPPNPNITSGVHIHRGTSQQNGPFQYALQIQVNADGVSGTVKGEYTLTDEQLQALNDGSLYVDLHTKGFRAGELRGILKAYTL